MKAERFLPGRASGLCFKRSVWVKYHAAGLPSPFLSPVMLKRWLAVLFVPVLLPLACAWVRAQERRILAQGVSLPPESLADARALELAPSTAERSLLRRRLEPQA